MKKLIPLLPLLLFLYRCEYQVDNNDIKGNQIIITTEEASDVGLVSAKITGHLGEIFEQPVTACGHCWSTSEKPTIDDNKYTITTIVEQKDFSGELSNLEDNTTYYARAYYILNGVAIYSSNEVEFTTLFDGTFTDIDGNFYKAVKLGNQWWMAENLKTTRYADGEALVNGKDVTDISGDYSKKYYFSYSNLDGYIPLVGRLYTYIAATNGIEGDDLSTVQGVCPDGWHLPNDAEWQQLEKFLGMGDAELNITGARGTDQGLQIINAGSSSGFDVLMAGFRYIDGSFANVYKSGFFWTASSNGGNTAWYRELRVDSPNIYRYGNDFNNGYSIRCVKNND